MPENSINQYNSFNYIHVRIATIYSFWSGAS